MIAELDALLALGQTESKLKGFATKDLEGAERPFGLFFHGSFGEVSVDDVQMPSDGFNVPKEVIPRLSSAVDGALPILHQDPQAVLEIEAISTAENEINYPSHDALYMLQRVSNPLEGHDEHRNTELCPRGSDIRPVERDLPAPSTMHPLRLASIDADVKMVRSTDGHVTGFTIDSTPFGRETATTSGSLNRAPASRRDFVRGSVNNVPFRPGGLEEMEERDATSVKNVKYAAPPTEELLSFDTLLTSVKGFADGIDFTTVRVEPMKDKQSESQVWSCSICTFENSKAADVCGMCESPAPATAASSADGASSGEDGKELNESAPYKAGLNPRGLLEDAAHSVNGVEDAKAVSMFDQVFGDLSGGVLDDEDDDDLGAEQMAQDEAARAHNEMNDMKAKLLSSEQEDENVDDFLSGDNDDIIASNEAALLAKIEQQSSDKKKIKKEWAFNDNHRSVADFYTRVPNMAMRWPFELDPFQKQAVMRIEEGHFVFVAAHTSAGKTVVAEYAIALACKHLTRAVYTSPIKTLSNQKFREFRKTFGDDDVGIITGDVSMNPDASCLILTTEILRSMLYKGADLIRDIEWVIFDEVHYINDLERGVVWEEVIIMLPAHVKIIMLSATVPNVMEFARWVGRTKKRPVYVVSTLQRPVPLQHYLWVKGKLFNIVDQKKKFLSDGVRKARMDGIKVKDMSDKKAVREAMQKEENKFRKVSPHRWTNLARYLEKRELLPVVVFAFSKNVCEEAANSCLGLSLNTSKEKSEVHIFMKTVLDRMSPPDRKLPQVLRCMELAKNGLGVHHAGMLPILKEAVEMIFGRGLIKVLFATETFAMGVNMPTRSVVFEDFKKHDGSQRRDLLPGEYTQMAGRAGRRGLDTFGVVIINCRFDKIPDEQTLRSLITGLPTKLESKFRLTYNMILNLLRQEDMRVEEMIKRSFGENAHQKDTPQRKQLLAHNEKELRKSDFIQCIYNDPSLIEGYHFVHTGVKNIRVRLMVNLMLSGKLSQKYLKVGRILLVSKYNLRSQVAVVAAPYVAPDEFSSENAGRKEGNLLVIIKCPDDYQLPRKVAVQKNGLPMLVKRDRTMPVCYLVTTLRPEHLLAVGTDTVGKLANNLPSNVRDWHPAGLRPLVLSLQQHENTYLEQAASEGKTANSTERKSMSAITSVPETVFPSRHPVKDLKLHAADVTLANDMHGLADMEDAMANSPCRKCPKLEEHYDIIDRQARLRERVTKLKGLLSDDNVALIRDFELHLNVLKQLQYINEDRTVQLKGRVACEINTCDSLVMTELIFENVLETLVPEEIVSLLSCMIFQQRVDSEVKLTDKLVEARTSIVRITTAVAEVQQKHNIPDIIPAEYVRNLINDKMMEVAYEWARGTSFAEICKLTPILEGSIVRCIVRLDETCRDVRNAARVIGNAALYQKMEKCSELIKRDIVFAASLYIQ